MRLGDDKLPSVALGLGDDQLTMSAVQGITDNARRIGIVRYALVQAFQKFRTGFAGKKGEADMKFINLYNSGQYLPHIYKLLGDITIQTLRRWNTTLGASNDWTLLCPQYHVNKQKVPRLNPVEERIFFSLWLSPNKLSIGDATRLAIFLLSKHETPTTKCAQTFRRAAQDFEAKQHDIVVLLREGQKALRDKVEPCITRDPSLLEVGDVLVADGHRLNFQVINPFTGKPCRATLVGYLDWKSYDLAGYEIMIEENTQCIASALRNAILRLGFIPKVSYQDNGKAFRARFFTGTESFEESGLYGLFARLGIVPVFAKPYNARAKIIERWFKEFSDTFERLLPSFTGASIEDKPAWMLRNEKFHKALHNEYVPTIEEAVQLIEAWLEFHRSQPCPHVKGKTIGEVFNEGRGMRDEGRGIQELDDLMMAIEIKNIRQNGIRFLNADYYDDNLYGLRDRVMIRYSLFDLTYIKVYTPRGEFLCTAKRVMPVHPMAHYLGEVKDVEELKHKLAQQKRLERQTVVLAKGFLAANGRAPQLDWQKVVANAPGVIEKIENDRKDSGPCLPAGRQAGMTEVRQIPDAAVKAEEYSVPGTEENIQQHTEHRLQIEKPIFAEAWQRFEYLSQTKNMTEDERRWLAHYRSSEEYRIMYGNTAAAGLG